MWITEDYLVITSIFYFPSFYAEQGCVLTLEKCSRMCPCLNYKFWFYLFCPFQGESSLPEETEAAVWNKAGDELSILMCSVWGHLCYGSTGNQSDSPGNQGKAGCKHCRTLHEHFSLTVRPPSGGADINQISRWGFMTQMFKLLGLFSSDSWYWLSEVQETEKFQSIHFHLIEKSQK